ncbi:MAG: FAD-dependent oxidoreductase [Rhodospirillaceae bacterium]|nr:FAD-dependent oxidoreductase [Rhodospirillaceae bacterium]
MAETRHVVVVGAGIVGLSCAFFLKRAGFDVTVIDRDPDGDRTSFGNAGAIAQTEFMPIAEPGVAWKVPGYLFDPLGPLSIKLGYAWRLWPYMSRFLAAANPDRFEAGAQAMAALLAPAFEDHGTILQSSGLGHLLSRGGHIWVYKSEAARAASAAEWALRERLGYRCEALDRAGVEHYEPALSARAACGYRTEDWGHYADPKALVLGLMDHLRQRGVAFCSGEVFDIEIKEGRPTAVFSRGENRLAFDHLVIAAGAWSHHLSNRLGDYCPLETERGYNTTLPSPDVQVNAMVTFAEERFVMTPMSMGLRIGGAVEFAGLKAPPNYSRAQALLKLANRYLPDLNTSGGTEWMGHRPSTPDSLPVIDRSQRFDNIYYAFGHGHLGLTGSATTGRLIASLVRGEDPGIDLAPFRIARFD